MCIRDSTTRIHDPRCELVLEQLLRHGAPPETALAAKPHIGTDLLKGVVTSIRQRIQQLGGQVEFHCTVTGFRREGDRLKAIVTDKGEIPCEVAVLAVGHSARPLFRTLADEGFALTRKAFSVGVRAEHLQETIDRGRYGTYAGKAELQMCIRDRWWSTRPSSSSVTPMRKNWSKALFYCFWPRWSPASSRCV